MQTTGVEPSDGDRALDQLVHLIHTTPVDTFHEIQIRCVESIFYHNPNAFLTPEEFFSLIDHDTIKTLRDIYRVDFELHGYEDTIDKYLGYSYESKKEENGTMMLSSSSSESTTGQEEE